MPYLALGVLALALFYGFTGRRRPVLKRREWRLLTAAFALAACTAAAWAGVRGEWGVTIVLVVLGASLAGSARQPGQARPPAQPASTMSAAEARRILGVEEGASPAEIQAAYTRLMRRAHPDAGGTAGLAAQLNAARDVLLSR